VNSSKLLENWFLWRGVLSCHKQLQWQWFQSLSISCFVVEVPYTYEIFPWHTEKQVIFASDSSLPDYFSYSVKKRVIIEICIFNSQLSHLCSYATRIFCSIVFFCPLENSLLATVNLWQFLTCFLVRYKWYAAATKNYWKRKILVYRNAFCSFRVPPP